MKFFISPSRLKTLREQNSLSVTGLGSRLKNMKRPVSTKTISKIEADENETRSVREYILANLAAGLKVSPKVLSGDEPLPAKHAPSDRVELQIDAKTRLNYDLIERRYDVSIEDIVNIAPLLFIKTAKESLARQKTALALEVANAIGAYNELSGDNMPDTLDTVPVGYLESIDEDDDKRLYERLAAINQNDLFNETVSYEEGPHDSDHNPFADYLTHICATEIGFENARVDSDDYYGGVYYFPGNRIPRSTVCYRDEIEITLGSREAGLALSRGLVRIKDIPEEFWEPRESGNRVAWLEDEYAAAQKQKEMDDDDEANN
jgi:transcriptional regulator with XRE-family HTH domain